VDLRIVRELQRGETVRSAYTLEMRLFEVEVVKGEVTVPQEGSDVTQYQRTQWANERALQPAAERGSLCCRLYLAWVASK
jgi:hypothetical protein